MISVFAVMILAYGLGSVPASIIAGKVLSGIDIRHHGSGNAGATNTFRILGWQAGVLVLAWDVFKGFAAAWWLPDLVAGAPPGLPLWAGIAAVCGHIWPVFAGFRGGKGVATLAGVFAALAPLALAGCLGIFLAVLLLTRVVALASIAAAVSLPLILSVFRYALGWPVSDPIFGVGFCIAALVLFTHRSNLCRVLANPSTDQKPPRCFPEK